MGGRCTRGESFDTRGAYDGIDLSKRSVRPQRIGDTKYYPKVKAVDIFLCNKCGGRDKTDKVVVYALANILCFSCRSKMQAEIMDIAGRYLIGSV